MLCDPTNPCVTLALAKLANTGPVTFVLYGVSGILNTCVPLVLSETGYLCYT